MIAKRYVTWSSYVIPVYFSEFSFDYTSPIVSKNHLVSEGKYPIYFR